MAKIVVVTSGKGGVGKTTTSASFASGLALRGHKTAVIDFDVGLRNLDLIMGCERRVVYDLINVIHGEANLNQALIKDKQCDNLFVLAASQTRDKDALTQDGVGKVLSDLAGMGFETYAIASAIIGGTSFFGGKGRIFSVVIGGLIIGTINNGLNILQVQTYYQLVVMGGLIIAAVALDRLISK